MKAAIKMRQQLARKTESLFGRFILKN